MSFFDMSNVDYYDIMFRNVKGLRYINLYKVQDNNKIIEKTDINKIDKLTVCQKGNIITNEKRIDDCCYFNIESDKCESFNYIIIHYGEKVKYEKGFGFDPENIDSYFIILSNWFKKYTVKDELEIKAGTKITVYFKSDLISLKSFLNPNHDDKAKNIKSIDMTHLRIPLLKNTAEMFYGCESIESIDLSIFEQSSITDMGGMFYNCKSL